MVTYFLKLILVALTYYVSGRLGLFLTIPPGQATAVWPASGIALASLLLLGYRFWPAVFFGAMGVSLYHPDVISLRAITIAALIASGASIQACLGCYLVKRKVKLPTALETVPDIFYLIVFGGLISCFVNATISNATLHFMGFVPFEALGFQWFTWWTGDVIGVVVFTPTLLLLFSNKSLISPLRKSIVGISLLISFLVAVALFTITKEQDRIRKELEFKHLASGISIELKERLGDYLEILSANGGFISASPSATYNEFSVYMQNVLNIYPGIQALSWNKRVPHHQRAEFEASMQGQGLGEYFIKHRVGPDQSARASKQDLYFPVTYLYPFESNKSALGYDTYGPDKVSGNVRITTLDAARDIAEAQTTGRISIVQAEGQYGLLIYHPVYRGGLTPTTVELRRANLIGYTAGVFIVPNMVSTTAELAKNLEVSLILRDKSSPKDKQLMYDSRTPDFKESVEPIKTPTSALKIVNSFNLAGHNWEIEIIEAGKRLTGQYSWGLWAVLIGGLSFTGLLGISLLTITAQTAIVERTVESRTIELNAAVKNLARSNEELEQFAYVASHDLQEPLRILKSYAELLGDNYKNELDEEGKKWLHFLVDGAARMKQLVQDLLAYSRVGKHEVNFSPFNINKLVEQVLNNLSASISENQAEITIDDFPICLGDPTQIHLLFQNLIANAIKFHKPDQHPKIHIGVKSNGIESTFSIRDNGIGMDTEHLERIFIIFQRLHSKYKYDGTGLGLAICNKIMDRHCGRIWVESKLNQGSTFFFTLKMSLTK